MRNKRKALLSYVLTIPVFTTGDLQRWARVSYKLVSDWTGRAVIVVKRRTSRRWRLYTAIEALAVAVADRLRAVGLPLPAVRMVLKLLGEEGVREEVFWRALRRELVYMVVGVGTVHVPVGEEELGETVGKVCRQTGRPVVTTEIGEIAQGIANALLEKFEELSSLPVEKLQGRIEFEDFSGWLMDNLGLLRKMLSGANDGGAD